MENRFNLIDEPWIPIADYGRASLKEVFSNKNFQSLGGNPIQKIAVFKLLLAIAQAAATPENEAQWQALGADGLAQKCLAYLDKWYDCFYLYGEKPFLQMPQVVQKIEERTKARLAKAKTAGDKGVAELSGKPKSFGSGFYPDLPSENNTFLSHSLQERKLNEAEQALFLVGLMNFAFGGKRVEADLTSLGGNKLGNRHTAKAGPSMGGYWGYLHSFVLGENLAESIWLNLLTKKIIEQRPVWSGLGNPPWESMPENESCERAKEYSTSYMSALVALSRFVLLSDNGIYYLEGICYPNTKDGWFEPSIFLDNSGKDTKVKYVDPEKRPWRELQALLSLQNKNMECMAVRMGLERAHHIKLACIWSAGLKASSNSGDQSVKQSDDFVESSVWLVPEVLDNSYIDQLNLEMTELDSLAKTLYGRVMGYFKALTVDGKNIAANATNLFWQLCERDFQALVLNCENDPESNQARQKLRRKFASYQRQAYDHYCPNETARQIDAWAHNLPNHSKYLAREAS